MGLCPDCSAEGETVTYVGASRSDIVDEVDGDKPKLDVESKVETTECDLCGDEYPIEGDSDE